VVLPYRPAGAAVDGTNVVYVWMRIPSDPSSTIRDLGHRATPLNNPQSAQKGGNSGQGQVDLMGARRRVRACTKVAPGHLMPQPLGRFVGLPNFLQEARRVKLGQSQSIDLVSLRDATY
jgi:hypothetical protein